MEDGVSALVSITEKALQVRDNETRSVMTGITKSGADFFAARSFHGLDIHCESNISEPFLIGRSGKASGYTDDLTRQ